MIDEATKQKILDAADILEVISDYVSLKKRGANYVGNCPFHNEKTASFTVSPAKGIFKCFGCGKVGDVVRFVMEYEQVGYYDALRRLADRYHIKIEERVLTEKERIEKGEKESMYVLNKYAASFFSEQLTGTDEGRSVALGYLTSRDMTLPVIEKFGIGYDPSGWDVFSKSALAGGYKEEYLLKTGLSIKSSRGTLIDRFNGRIMFPVKDISGKIIAFGGRTMSADKKVAKYQNSPESDIYHKKYTLYGIDMARGPIVRKDSCYLVEGYFDVVSFHMKGIENVVASSGTSLTMEQIHILGRLTKNITVMYDGDAAGIHAALRGIDLLIKEGLNVRVVLLPDGEDPDSFARSHTADELREFIAAEEKDFISFKTGLLLGEAKDDPIERTRAINEVIRTISLIPDNIARSVYIRKCSELTGMSERNLTIGTARILAGKEASRYGAGNERPRSDVQEVPQGPVPEPKKETGYENVCKKEEFELLRAILMYGNTDIRTEDGRLVSVAQFVSDDLEGDGLSFYNTVLRSVFNEYMAHYDEEGFDVVRYFSASSDSELNMTVADVLSDKYELDPIWKRGKNVKSGDETGKSDSETLDIPMLVDKLVDNYKLKRLTVKIKQVDMKIKELVKGENVSDEVILDWLKKKQVMNDVRTLLVKKMGRSAVQN